MGRASRKRAEQRESVSQRVFPLQPPQRAAPARDIVANGASWADLGRALGISRQGARQRYG